MLLVLFLAFRCVYAGTPHAVYGVPPVGTNFVSLQPQRNPPFSPGTQWATNPYSQQSTQAWKIDYHNQPGRPKPATAYWGGTYNYIPTPAAYQSGAKVISAASATYRPYSGSPPSHRVTQEFYNTLHRLPPTNNQFSNQRNDLGYYSRPGDSSDSRYNDFFRRYYDWYYQNAYRDASTGSGYYPPGYPQPPGDPGHREPLGAYSPPVPAVVGGGSPTSPSGAPWWLHGGFTSPAPAAGSALVTSPNTLASATPLPSSSSGGPVGPFSTSPAVPMTKRPFRKTTSQASSKRPGKASGTSLIANRIIEDSTYESHKTNSEEKPYSGTAAASETTIATGESSEAESKGTNSPLDSVTPETAFSSEESSSPSSEESSSPSSEESSSPSTEESSSPSSEESSSPSTEESSSPSSEESSSSSSEESSSPSTEDSSSSSEEESSSSSSEDSSSPSTEESSSPSTEESSSSSTEESSPPSSEDNSTADNVTTESSDSSESNTIKKDD